jgi:hypothetical protein
MSIRGVKRNERTTQGLIHVRAPSLAVNGEEAGTPGAILPNSLSPWRLAGNGFQQRESADTVPTKEISTVRVDAGGSASRIVGSKAR